MKQLLILFLLSSINNTYSQYSGTPLLLSLPMNQDTIEEDDPVFVWQTTLSNLANDPRLNVQLAVVKMEGEQTATEAIVENSPVFIRQNLLSSSLNYSSVDHELEGNTWYAWQVVLFYNGIQVQQSEVWKFIKAEPKVPIQPFIHLRKKADNTSYSIIDSKLKMCTQEKGTFNPDAQLSGPEGQHYLVHIDEVDINGEPMEEKNKSLETRYYTCDFSDLDLSNGYYRLEWKANAKTTFVLFLKK